MQFPHEQPGSRVGSGSLSRVLRCGLVILGVLLPGEWGRAFAASDAAARAVGLEGDPVVDFWRTEQGLPHNTVTALLQTGDGYLWLGTAAGLARFDGLTFKVLGRDTAPVLEQARITALLEDQQGGLWVGTQERGVVRIGGGRLRTFTSDEGLQDDTVTCLAEDVEGRVWIGTSGGLSTWDGGKLERFQSTSLRAGEPIVALHAGRSGVLWVTTRFEVYRLRGETAEVFRFEDMPQGRNADFVGVYEDRAGNLWTYGATFLLNLSQGRRFNYFRSLDPASSRVWTICEQEEGAFWIGTSGRGLFRFHDEDGRFEITGARDGLDQCDVRALHADHEGNLWIGTSGNGLARLRTRQWHVLGVGNGPNAPRLTDIAMDKQERLFVGTEGAGVLRLNGQQFEPLKPAPPLAYATHVRSLCTDSQNALWVGTWGLGLFRVAEDGQQWRFTSAEGLDDDVVLSLTAEPAGAAVWAGTLSGGLHRVTPTNVFRLSTSDGLSGQPVTCLLTAPDGSLLIGTSNGGLLRWDGQRVQPVSLPPEVGSSTVGSLMRDQLGRLWVGTVGAGAFCRVGNTWTPLGTGQGLMSDMIWQIVQDDAGHYWFNSDKGLFQVYAVDLEALLQGRVTSVPSVLCRRAEGADAARGGLGVGRALRSRERRLWFTTAEGLLTVDPTRAPELKPPAVMIEEVMVDGDPVVSSVLGEDVDRLRLGYGTRSLTFAYTAVSFSAPEYTRFRHKLEGFDLDWVKSDTVRRAHYGPLPPGSYRFRVIAVNADGVWNDVGDAMSLVVVPPFWRTWWFVSLGVMAGVGTVWAVVRFLTFRRLREQLRRTKQQRMMERERARIAQDMHDEIGSKLTRISFLSEAARYKVTESGWAVPQVEAIADTSRNLLQALDEIVWAVNPRNDNLEHLVGYLEQYAREYFHNTPVLCSIHVPDQLPGIPLTAEVRHNVFLAFEEALSNVLQHSGARHARVGMELSPNLFAVQIHDDGRGFSGSVHRTRIGHDGLQNMRDRLRLVGGACSITSEIGKGTTVRLWFPLNGAPETPALRRTAANL